jgi:hypothetical protein
MACRASAIASESGSPLEEHAYATRAVVWAYSVDRRTTALVRTSAMPKAFKVGDHVSWNSEAGRVRGTILRVHRKDVNYKGYVHHADADDPQYEIKSDKTDHVALHKGRALRLLSH